MIPRYVRKEMGRIWSDQNKFSKWLKVELAVLWTRYRLGALSRYAWRRICSRAHFTVEEIETLDKEIGHDMNAFIGVVQKYINSRYAGEFHKELTSYDVEEPALAIQTRESIDLIKEDIKTLKVALLARAKEHKWTIMAGRTHGVQAEAITFGLKLLVWYEALNRRLKMLDEAREVINVGKTSGAVGTYTLPPVIEEMVCKKLGMKPAKISTQILQRDRHAQVITALAITAGTVEQIATELRRLCQTEIGEVQEPFTQKQKGSSAMAHKKNPVLLERICGLARVIRNNAGAALEDIATWAERDITQSSVERVIFPDSFQALDYIIDRLTWVIEKMEVFPERMLENLEKTQGTIFSQQVRVWLLEKGMEPEAAYRLTQETCFEAIRKSTPLIEILLLKPELCEYPVEEIKTLFNYRNQLIHIDQIFARFGI